MFRNTRFVDLYLVENKRLIQYCFSIRFLEDARSKARRSIDSGNAHGFHPDFDLLNVEDIPEAELPEPPKEKGTPSSVRKFFESVESTPKSAEKFSTLKKPTNARVRNVENWVKII